MADRDALRVTKLTLFSHGVASLRLHAAVSGDATLSLSFAPRHMNDVLKSLVVTDVSSAGRIAAISYPSPSSSPRAPLPSHAALSSLLHASQGAHVSVVTDTEEVDGVLLGLEPVHEPAHAGADVTSSHRVVLVRDMANLFSCDLRAVSSIVFRDPFLQRQLAARLADAREAVQARDNKVVTISAQGEGSRDIVASYAVESPVYKLTYRLLLRPNSDAILVQGWVIVDNPADDDLVDVDVAIVSGLPISFRHDLYAARYVERPEEDVPTADGPGYGKPSAAAFGTDGLRKSKKLRAGRSGAAADRLQLSTMAMRRAREADSDDDTEEGQVCGFGGGGAPPGEASELPPLPTGPAMPMPSQPPAEATEVGDLFEYNIPGKVTIRAHESALLPLIMHECAGGRVDVYSHAVRETNTLSAARIKNSTDATWEGGPASVCEGDRLVGEAMLKMCRPNSEQFLPYSVDLDCAAERKKRSRTGSVFSSLAVGGYFKASRHREQLTEYVFRNNKTDDIDLFVLHETLYGYELQPASVKIEPRSGQARGSQEEEPTEASVKPVDVSPGTARYRIALPGGQTARLIVVERKTEYTRYSIQNSCNETSILHLLEQNVVSEKTASKMREVMQLEAEIDALGRDIDAKQTMIDELGAGQKRYRENLASLGGLHESEKFRDNSLITRYIDSLAASELQIHNISQQIQPAREKLRELRATVKEKIIALGNQTLD